MYRRKDYITGIIVCLLFLVILANISPRGEGTTVTRPPRETYRAEVTQSPDITTVPLEDNPGKHLLELEEVPEYKESPYVVINKNKPFFSKEELKVKSFEYYGEQDELGRCGMVWACIGQDIMPTEEREAIGHVRPAGWHTVKYDIIDGLYLYNRCHLIGYQLAGENDNINNLITGTRYMNVVGMLPFENAVADYVEKTGNHVMYRVTPMYMGEELLARGVLMEAYSVEDFGVGICYNVFVYNVQPGIGIDYATGNSWVMD